MKVLIVDDEPPLCDIAKAFLDHLGGFEVDTVGSAAEGLHLLQTSEYEAVVSDYQMPGIDGLEFLRLVRECSKIPFILFTGKGREEVAIQALNLGADYYLQKGGDPQAQFAELANMIRKSVGRERAERALEESERKYRLLAENSRDVIWKMDVETLRFTFISPGIVHLRGFTVEETISQHLSEIVTPDDYRIIAQDLPERIRRFLGGDESMRTSVITAKQWRRDGTVVPVEISSTLLVDDDGMIREIIGVARDVSERVRATEALLESQRKLSTLMGNLPGMAYRCLNDPDWTMEFVSEGCEELTGYSQSELQKNTKKSYASLILPEDRARVWETVQHGLARGRPFKMVYRIRTAKDETKWVWERGRGVRSADGQLIALEGFIADITERKELERALNSSEAKYRALMENANDAIVVSDIGTGTVIDANDRALTTLGLTIERVQGMSVSRLFRQEDATRYAETYRKHVNSENGCVSEELLVDSGGCPIPVIVSSRKLEVDGRPTLIAIFHNISESKSMQEALATANKKLNLLNSITRHDLLNQLTVLRGMIDLGRMNSADPKTIVLLDRLDSIGRSMQRSLEFTRSYQEISAAAPQWQSLRKALEGAMRQAEHLDLPFSVSVDAGDFDVFADSLLGKVFYNIIDNSARHGGIVSRVDFTTHLNGGSLLLVCTDDGIGVPHDQRERIFERGVGRNGGFGLFLSREILGITGIGISEEGCNRKGACFVIEMPEGTYRPHVEACS